MPAKNNIFLLMLIFVPIAIGAEWLKASPLLVFGLSAVAIIPLAFLIAEETEGIAAIIGPTLGGLLNATFGNLTEMVVSVVALRAGLVEVVKYSILGAIIANLLLGLGLAMFLGGLRAKQQHFRPEVARLNASSLLLSVLVLLTPGAIDFTSIDLHQGAIEKFSLVTAILLLVFYGLNFIFSLKSGDDTVGEHSEEKEEHRGGLTKPILTLLVCTIALVVVSEILVGSLEEAVKVLGLTELFTGIILLPLFAGVVEYITCVRAAVKDQMELAVSVAIGSTLQIILFVAPLLVLVSLLFSTPLTLEFNAFGMFATTAAILITNSISSDGQSNWLEGVLLLLLYVVLGTAFYLHP
ncbi:MAG: Ca(2+)/H(+) antiporter [Chroococcopsis gigantea SAG 12.99]|jgi:Ca2+:H+ antiporter|nr:Ca(2+)/H(+) antiporter [Chroococcopsis gigantea SAG 12.99]